MTIFVGGVTTTAMMMKNTKINLLTTYATAITVIITVIITGIITVIIA